MRLQSIHARGRHAGPVAHVAITLVLVAGCGPRTDGTPSAGGLGPPETFDWVDQPIAFAPPPPEWRRDGYGNGDRRGIWFVKEHSGGEVIIVAEVDLFHDRDRSAALRQLLDRLDAYEDRDLSRALTLARWRTDMPFFGNEAEVAAAVNVAVDRAVNGMVQQDRSEVRRALMEANDAAARLEVRLEDVLASPTFQPERRAQPDRYRVHGRENILVAGDPAQRVDYTWRIDDKVLEVREVYVMHGNQLFVASIQHSTTKDFGVFDRVVESIAFPPPQPIAAR
jgi:hypothetical protein